MADVWFYLCDRFWGEGFWLPEGYSWKDFKSESNDLYYPQVHDINWCLPIALLLLLVRFLYERMIITPIAKRLGLKDTKCYITPNPVLEKVFKQNKGRTTQTDLLLLSKKTELTVREIERWFFKRRRKDSPSPLLKFREIRETGFGKLTVIGWPKQHVDRDMYTFYLLELGFYWGLMITFLRDVKKSAAKMALYSKRETLGGALFACFVVLWLMSRMGLYPFWVIRFILFHMHEVCPITGYTHTMFVGLLCGLQVIHCFWTYLILKIAVNKLTKGKVVDVRSDDESGDKCSEDDAFQSRKINGINGSVHTMQ